MSITLVFDSSYSSTKQLARCTGLPHQSTNLVFWLLLQHRTAAALLLPPAPSNGAQDVSTFLPLTNRRAHRRQLPLACVCTKIPNINIAQLLSSFPRFSIYLVLIEIQNRISTSKCSLGFCFFFNVL
jgi:hypothetical protein